MNRPQQSAKRGGLSESRRFGAAPPQGQSVGRCFADAVMKD
jgi:hypothetical protein